MHIHIYEESFYFWRYICCIYQLISFSMVLRRNEVKLIVLNDVSLSCVLLCVFYINMTSATFLQLSSHFVIGLAKCCRAQEGLKAPKMPIPYLALLKVKDTVGVIPFLRSMRCNHIIKYKVRSM